jgi:signal transduction histidine kinase/CheY-like chemotaxis protein
MIFTGLIATASATMSHVVKIFVTFVLFSMVPTAFKFYTLSEPQYYWICALIFLYIITVLIASRGIRKSTAQAIELQFQNLDLVESLTEQNIKTEAALQEAQRASKAKTRFFAAANHDLRQPLHSLGLFTATLASQVENPEQRRIVDHIDNSVKSLEELFNSILDISALDAGTLKVHKQHFNIKDYFDRIAPDLSELAKEKNLYFDVAVGDHVVYSDPTLLHRIINNLAVNAIAYTENGGIRIVSEIVGPNLQISVIDTGKGIADEQVHAIFDEFVQLNNPERDRTKGLGLGLSIVQRITDLLDIELNLQTKAGEGSAFHIVLEGGNPALANADSDTFFASEHSLDGQFVLVIDDEAEARLAMEGLLLSWSCEVMLASSGAEAVQQLEEYGQIPSLIISDFRLRVNENGGDAIHAIKQHFDVDVPAIIITGDTAPEQLREIDKLQLPTLHKPCKPAELKALLFALTN